MSLIRWQPKSEWMDLPSDLDRFFGDFGLDFWKSDTVWQPAVDIVETKNNFEVKAELPGLKKDDIKIQFEDGVLTLTGERKIEKEDKDKNFYRVERRYGKFQRCFSLPRNVKADEIKANYKDGILTVNIPKAEEAKAKEIEIK
ncbi:hypothetical protein B6D60_09780 [candidate division KSB1 bacterium 4484_87]|nr:MAG: hypothetical protein B6D60_09780 [candidate division KSB1 bacterium 4484_87]